MLVEPWLFHAPKSPTRKLCSRALRPEQQKRCFRMLGFSFAGYESPCSAVKFNDARHNWNPGWWKPGWWSPGWWNPGWWSPGWWNPGCWNPGWWSPGWWSPGWWSPSRWSPSWWSLAGGALAGKALAGGTLAGGALAGGVLAGGALAVGILAGGTLAGGAVESWWNQSGHPAVHASWPGGPDRRTRSVVGLSARATTEPGTGPH